MKRFLSLILLLLSCMLIFASCAPEEEHSHITTVGTRAYFYRKDADGRIYFDFEVIDVQGESVTERAEKILEAMKTPASEGAYIALPEYVYVTSIQEKGSGLIIDFSESYKYLDADQRLVAMVAVSRSLLSDSDIVYISITCKGEPQPPFYSGYINRNTFIFDDKVFMN